MNLPAPLSCPACEYSSGSPGKPAAAGPGRMICMACGAQWREMGIGQATRAKTPAVFEAQPVPMDATANRSFRITNGMVWASGALAIFLAVALPLSHLAGRSAPGVEISSLSARQLVREGQVAVRIEGRITNRSKSRQVVRSVDVVLTGGDGRVYGWTHRPAVPWLEPGESIRFATANGNIPRTADRAEVSSAGVTAEVNL